ncbi:MAG: OB-fold nucleic acid binding domain-containing protein [Candidatus Diapherotrites archaeon]|nr:OB-fold nucleic acid binding domain-containing protein [Candidatus Diapherotrites archaeon]
MLLRECLLRRIALLCAAVGIILLFVYSSIDSPKRTKISEVKISSIGDKVEIDAIVSSSKVSGNVLIFELDDGDKITSVFFNPRIEQKIILRKGNFVRVSGRIAEYRGNLEIVAEKVLLID